MTQSAPEATDLKSLAVLEAATAVFLEHGFSAATTDMIQQAAGVSKATVYKRYCNKETLFRAVLEQQCQRFHARLSECTASEADIRTTLTELGESFLQVLLSQDSLALLRTVVAEATRFPELAHFFYMVGPQQTFNIVARYLNGAITRGEIDTSQIGVESAASQFIGLLRGEAHMEYLTHPSAIPSEAHISKMAEQAVDTFLQAFQRPSG
ncbi:TetR/AcrR family transcriptional regulator [Oceanobacter mangrovi]|uniref:TetR/AcrR family transcriptional regulator n=1 Tax=Oceanobacter mangrovi TaxID=2862510 RepID=UPI001C8D59D0|nr:TetR/AcrR family transcriptional regulator [Oceanobacter mangrovi]